MSKARTVNDDLNRIFWAYDRFITKNSGRVPSASRHRLSLGQWGSVFHETAQHLDTCPSFFLAKPNDEFGYSRSIIYIQCSRWCVCCTYCQTEVLFNACQIFSIVFRPPITRSVLWWVSKNQKETLNQYRDKLNCYTEILVITIYSYMQTTLSAEDASDQFMIDFNFFPQIGQGAIIDPHCT